MRATLLVGAAAAALALTGCASATTPTPSPSPTSASPTSFVPARPEFHTPETPTLPAGTVTALSGRLMRVIKADPGASFACRKPNADEMGLISQMVTMGLVSQLTAVDVGEGWAVVVMWFQRTNRDRDVLRYVTNGERLNSIAVDDWNGQFSAAGVMLADGPKGIEAARRCIGAL